MIKNCSTVESKDKCKFIKEHQYDYKVAKNTD